MPIVSIQLVQDDVRVPQQRLQDLSDALGVLFESEPAGTWVRLSYLDRDQYAENQSQLGIDTQPTFVEVLKGQVPAADALAVEAEQVAEIVAQILQRPKTNTHVLYLPAAAGRIAFGGRLVSA